MDHHRGFAPTIENSDGCPDVHRLSSGGLSWVEIGEGGCRRTDNDLVCSGEGWRSAVPGYFGRLAYHMFASTLTREHKSVTKDELMAGRWAISHLYRLAASRGAAAAAWKAQHPHRNAAAANPAAPRRDSVAANAAALGKPVKPASQKVAKIGLRHPPPGHPSWKPGGAVVSALGVPGATRPPRRVLWVLLLAALTVLLRPAIMAVCRRLT